jgi:hypothetical protein
VVLGLAVGAKPRQLLAVAVAVAVAVAGLGLGLDEHLAALVAGHRLVGLVGFVQLEVGAGRVEEQQIHFKVKQAGQLPEHLALQRGRDLVQPVHRPVTRIVCCLGQAVDVDVMGDPGGGGQLGGGLQRPVGDQAQQHALHTWVQPPSGAQLGHDRVDA